jgi:hypothetical protein
MKLRASARRVANALLALGVLSLSLVTLSQLTSTCSAAVNNCLVASVSFSGPMDTALPFVLDTSAPLSTPSTDVDADSMVRIAFDVIQITSVYLIMIGVLVLIGLEMRELHYLKRLVTLRKS